MLNNHILAVLITRLNIHKPKIPKINEIIKPRINGHKAVVVVMSLKFVIVSTNAAPNMVGMANKKENLNASSFLMPDCKVMK